MMEAAPALAAYRASRGLRTLVVYIEDVYDAFIGNVIGDPDQVVNPQIATK